MPWDRFWKKLIHSNPESRARLVQQVCRVGGQANTVTTAESPNYPLWMHVVATAITTSHAEQRERILLPLREGYTSFTKQWEETFAALAAFLGLRIRPESDISQFVMVLTALDQGFALRHRINGKIEYVTRPTGPNGENEDWTLFALGLEALVHQFFEIDPDWQPERRDAADNKGLRRDMRRADASPGSLPFVSGRVGEHPMSNPGRPSGEWGHRPERDGNDV